MRTPRTGSQITRPGPPVRRPRAAQHPRAKVGKENGDANAHRDGDDHGDDAGDQGAIDGASAPKRSRVGLQASVVMKPKPKALKAGIDPTTKEAMTPQKIASTKSAANRAVMRNRTSPAPARRAVSTRAERSARDWGFSCTLISVKRRPRQSHKAMNRGQFTPGPRHEHHSLAKLL